MVLLYNFL